MTLIRVTSLDVNYVNIQSVKRGWIPRQYDSKSLLEINRCDFIIPDSVTMTISSYAATLALLPIFLNLLCLTYFVLRSNSKSGYTKIPYDREVPTLRTIDMSTWQQSGTNIQHLVISH